MNAIAEVLSPAVDEMPVPLIFTDSAAAKVADLVAEEGNPELKLRVFVQGAAAPAFNMASPSTRSSTKTTPRWRRMGSRC